MLIHLCVADGGTLAKEDLIGWVTVVTMSDTGSIEHNLDHIPDNHKSRDHITTFCCISINSKS